MPWPHTDSPTHPSPSSDEALFDYLYPFESLPIRSLTPQLTDQQLTSPQITTQLCPVESHLDPNETLEDYLYPFKSQEALDSALDTLEHFLASLEEQRMALGKTTICYPVSHFPVPFLQLLTCLYVLLSYSTLNCTTSPTPPFRRPVPPYHLPRPLSRQTRPVSLKPLSMVARTGLPSGSLDEPLDEPTARYPSRHASPVTSTAARKSARPPEIFEGTNNHQPTSHRVTLAMGVNKR